MRKLIISLSAAFAILAPLAAQDLETGYFLGGNPYAFRLNPAFQSERNILSIGLGMTGLSAISNLGFSTMLYPEGGKLYTCLNDHVSASELLGKLHRNNYMDLGARVNLLTVGFWSGRNFFTIDINVRNQEGVSLPYDLFRFIKGDKTEGSVFECASFGIRSQTFAEAAFGWSRSFDNHLSVGVRGKFIVGALGEDLTLNKLRVTIGDESWSVDSHGRLTVSSPAVSVGVVEDTDIMNPRSFNFDWSKAGPAGWGGALDLGFRYDITPLLTVSGALLDLGAIRWNQEIAYETPDKTYEWAPSSEKTSASGFPNEVMELLSVGSGFLAWREDKDAHPEFRLMPFRVNAGAEFRMPFYDRLSVGALYQGHFVNTFARHTGRMSLNWNPWDFLSLSTSATFTRLGESMGVALNLHPNGINLVLGCDYIPFHCVDLSPVLEDVDPKYARFLRCPRDQFKLNAYVGLNIAFGRSRLDHRKQYR